MTTYLITGANRGIERVWADIILSQPNNTLIALLRNPDHPTSQSLAKTKCAQDSKVIILRYEANDHTGASSAIKTLKLEHDITHLDVVVANTGMQNWQGPSSAMLTPEAVHQHVAANTVAPLLLFQATLSLLLEASRQGREAKFVVMSGSCATGSKGINSRVLHSNAVAYGMAEAAMKYAFRELDLEYPEIDVEVLTPDLW